MKYYASKLKSKNFTNEYIITIFQIEEFKFPLNKTVKTQNDNNITYSFCPMSY